jgi:hypothetical protein
MEGFSTVPRYPIHEGLSIGDFATTLTLTLTSTPQSDLERDTAKMTSSRPPSTVRTEPSTPTVSIDTTIASQSKETKPNSSLDGMPAADESLFEVMSKHYQQRIITQIRDCQALRFASSCSQTWNQDNRLQESMDHLMITLSEFEKFDKRYDYGVGDGTIYLPHLADPRPNRKNIERRLVEWASECEGDSLPTFEEALKQTRESGSAHQGLALSLDHVRGFRQLTQAEQDEYIVKWGKGHTNDDDEVEGVSV